MNPKSADYFSNFRRKEVVQLIAKEIQHHLGERQVSFMEVCGGHTASILRFGLSSLLPENLSLLSGPGCPVCVTPRETIDAAIACAKQQDVILATFGDLVRVPGSGTSLEQVRSEGARVEIIYGPDGALILPGRIRTVLLFSWELDLKPQLLHPPPLSFKLNKSRSGIFIFSPLIR